MWVSKLKESLYDPRRVGFGIRGPREYSSQPVGADHDALLRELESPEDDANPQLFFAGDYVTKHPGSTHSAYQSGVDAVRRAVALRKPTRTIL
jgi:hypothetical protein